MKKCLLISTPSSVFFDPVRHALERAGFEVRLFDYKKLSRRSLYWWGSAQLLYQAWRYQPDFIFSIKAKFLKGPTIKRLGKIATTANWYPETIDHWGGIMDAAPYYDFFFTFDEIVIDRLAKAGIHTAHYLPFCADVAPNAPWPQETGQLKYPIVFVGTYHPERSAREHILARVADLGLHIWGGAEWRQTSLAPYYRGWASNEQMIEIYRSSKMVINHYITDLPGDGVNLRPFEVTGAGALLMNHNGRKDIFRHFQDGKEFISFNDEHDIRDKVVWYLDHEDERRRVAKNGFLRTRRDHTYDLRIQSILETMHL